jgi:hypothetical protein
MIARHATIFHCFYDLYTLFYFFCFYSIRPFALFALTLSLSLSLSFFLTIFLHFSLLIFHSHILCQIAVCFFDTFGPFRGYFSQAWIVTTTPAW